MTVQVERSVVDSPTESGERIVFTIPTAEIGDKFLGYGATPRFRVGERYLLVMRNDPARRLAILGHGAGAIRLRVGAQLPPSELLRGLWSWHCDGEWGREGASSRRLEL